MLPIFLGNLSFLEAPTAGHPVRCYFRIFRHLALDPNPVTVINDPRESSLLLRVKIDAANLTRASTPINSTFICS